MTNILTRIEAIKPFTEREAWNLFRIAAFGEAIGWTLLITGIAWRGTDIPGNTIAVPIAGNLHGSLFLIYFAVLLATYSSLGWSRWKFLLAAAAGVPPFGSLVFEKWAAFRRRWEAQKNYRETFVYAIMCDESGNILGLQTRDSGKWHPIGGQTLAGESLDTALARLAREQTGGSIKNLKLVHVADTRQHKGSEDRLTIYYRANPAVALSQAKIARHITSSPYIDELAYISPDDFVPVLPIEVTSQSS